MLLLNEAFLEHCLTTLIENDTGSGAEARQSRGGNVARVGHVERSSAGISRISLHSKERSIVRAFWD